MTGKGWLLHKPNQSLCIPQIWGGPWVAPTVSTTTASFSCLPATASDVPEPLNSWPIASDDV